jgi:hypothetical protein
LHGMYDPCKNMHGYLTNKFKTTYTTLDQHINFVNATKAIERIKKHTFLCLAIERIKNKHSFA